MLVEVLQSCGVASLSVLGAATGVWLSHKRRTIWVLAFLVPFTVVILIGLCRRDYSLSFVPPFKWLVAGRIEVALIGACASMMMGTLIARLPKRRMRWFTSAFMVIFIGQSAVLPFLMPGLQKSAMAALQTRMGSDGFCRQSTDATCGPAAAVTALRSLGLPAEEGELAVLAHTSRSTGTEPDVLAAVLNERYGKDGLQAEYRVFRAAADLPRDRPTIALINYQMFVDHYVTVLGVDGNKLIIGYPLSGRMHESFEEFQGSWRMVGIVLTRVPVPKQ